METVIEFFRKKSAKNQRKLVCFLVFMLNVSWITFLVAQRHLYMGTNNHICRCGKRKNEFDVHFFINNVP